MACILGIDLGTSSIKAMLLDEEKGVIGISSRSYTVNIPKEGFGEQDPQMWWEFLKEVLRNLKIKYSREFSRISSVGFSGQMHGLVVVDKEGKPIRPAILWMDQRSGEEAKRVQEELGIEVMGKIFHNRVFSGFAFPSLLWIKENEPENFRKIYKILLPKDYIRYRMTGEFGTDASDGSSTSIFCTGQRDWAWEIIKKYSFPEEIFPKVHEAEEVAGIITESAAEETGLPKNISIVYGSGDQPAQSIGNGAVKKGTIISNIGTGGQISTYSDKDIYDEKLRIHTFCHGVNQAYTIFGATLCSGMSMNWMKDKILYESDFQTMSKEAGQAEPGSKGMIYLPYLSGERTPHMNPEARGMFFGLKLNQYRSHMIRSIMEGVVFSLKDSLEIFESIGLSGNRIIASGGGASSQVWLQIQADILEKEIKVCTVKEQACLGACIMAGIGGGLFKNVDEAVQRFVTFEDRCYEPREEYRQMYREQHQIYKELYENTKELMREKFHV